jgi:hypothetical protein
VKIIKGLLMAVALLAVFIIAYPIVYRINHPRAALPPAYETCVKCSHLFAPGTGKHVQVNESTNTYCSADAPKWDKYSQGYIAWTGGDVQLGRAVPEGYYVRQSEWKRVNEDGSEYQPHKCPEPEPCRKWHVESRPWTDAERGIWNRWATNVTLTNWVLDAQALTNTVDCTFGSTLR